MSLIRTASIALVLGFAVAMTATPASACFIHHHGKVAAATTNHPIRDFLQRGLPLQEIGLSSQELKGAAGLSAAPFSWPPAAPAIPSQPHKTGFPDARRRLLSRAGQTSKPVKGGMT